MGTHDSQETTQGLTQYKDRAGLANYVDGFQPPKMTPTGLEPSTNSAIRPPVLEEGGAKSSALGALDPDLQEIVDAWPDLSEAERRIILTIVQNAE